MIYFVQKSYFLHLQKHTLRWFELHIVLFPAIYNEVFIMTLVIPTSTRD